MKWDKAERMAPSGQVWKCQACGKIAVDRYGMEGYRSAGWDESCMLNATLVDDAPYISKILSK